MTGSGLTTCACGHDDLAKFTKHDLATWDDKMAKLTGVKYSGFAEL